MFLFNVSSVFAQTTLAELKAKKQASEKAGVITLVDMKKQLKASKQQAELFRIKGIAARFGTTDLHALKLTEDYNGDTIGDITNVVSTASLANIKKIVAGNGLTLKECKRLRPGFVFYIPTSMIDKDLLLNAFEVAQLKEDYEDSLKRNGLLAERNRDLKGDLGLAEKTNEALIAKKAELEKALVERTDAHIKTNENLVKAKKTIVERDNTIATMEVGGVEVSNYYFWVLMTALAIIAILIFIAYVLRRGSSKRKDDNVDLQRENADLHNNLDEKTEQVDELTVQVNSLTGQKANYKADNEILAGQVASLRDNTAGADVKTELDHDIVDAEVEIIQDDEIISQDEIDNLLSEADEDDSLEDKETSHETGEKDKK